MKTKTILSTSLSFFITAQAWGHDDHIHTSENVQATTNIFEKDHTTNNGEKQNFWARDTACCTKNRYL